MVMFDNFNKYRGKDGYINLDLINPIVLAEFNSNRKNRIWIMYEGIEFLYKTDYWENDGLREIIIEGIYRQLNRPNAEYDIAIYRGIKGALTKSFIPPKNTFINGEDFLLSNGKYRYDNTIKDYYEILVNLKRIGYNNCNLKNILDRLLELVIIDTLTGQNDRISSNLGFLIGTNNISLAPIFDSETAFVPEFSIEDMDEFNQAQDKAQFIDDQALLFSPDINQIAITNGLFSDNIYNEYWGALESVKTPRFIRKRMKEMDPTITAIENIDFRTIFKYIKDYRVNISETEKTFYKGFYDYRINEFEKRRTK